MEHTVIESKPDHFLDDLRLSSPWPELRSFVETIDLNVADSVVHKHTPYVIILLKVADEWAKTHGGSLPSTREEKKEFKELMRAKMRAMDEDNYKEAVEVSFKVQQNCIQCGVCMGKYYCSKCKFFDDDVSKNQYHCDKCGICRTGGKENFFHCNKCGCCYSRLMKDSHICIEKAMRHNCPVCFEYLFETTKDITVLPCGHTIHLQCVKEMGHHLQYSCPVCSKSYCDMSQVWQRLDHEVWILCNDCGETSEVNFHIVAHKCVKCNSYNTKQTRGGPASCSSGVEEMLPSLLPSFLNQKNVSSLSLSTLPIGSSKPSHHLITLSPVFAALYLCLRLILTRLHMCHLGKPLRGGR
ncbi:E3 ubiquitin-protein ligase RZFP34 [Camellia lanceoleosa]|uniref:E3 ubiquitin-protein ligase RZFP34 n=1 Tax=Camellia lanceoleosa TaxID=1840588 RepID=A0ACC0H2X5_9ERIC|nr:E3 ubiquitin-protein ligase RZFP34 [Camellia lanceoleosa]